MLHKALTKIFISVFFSHTEQRMRLVNSQQSPLVIELLQPLNISLILCRDQEFSALATGKTIRLACTSR